MRAVGAALLMSTLVPCAPGRGWPALLGWHGDRGNRLVKLPK